VTFPQKLLALASTVPLAACASAPTPAPTVGLSVARARIAAARSAGAELSAPEPLSRAQSYLYEAEALVAAATGKAAADKSRQAADLARLSATEAEWTASMAASGSGVASLAARCDAASVPADPDRRLRRALEEQQRLEERAALSMKELELTETEVVRTKARVRGQTKAEASSAIAEARILLRHVSDEKVKSPSLARSHELVDRAEEWLHDGNVAGAVFFAMNAQDLVEQARRVAADPAGLDLPVAKRTYFATGPVNVRSGPGASEAIVGRVPRGALVQARSRRGDWLLVSDGTLDG
jgi:Bacterial SH3 domain